MRSITIPHQVEECVFTPNSRNIFVSTDVGTVEVHATKRDQGDGPRRKLLGHTAGVVALEKDHSRRFLASGGKDAIVALWDMRELMCLRCVGARSISFSHNSEYIASCAYDSLVDISRVSDGKQLCGIDMGYNVNRVRQSFAD